MQKLFYKILVEDKFGDEIKMSVLNRYSKSDKKSIRVITELIEEDIKDGYCLFSVAKSGISALGAIGGRDIINYLEKLKKEYDGYDVDVDDAISWINKRLKTK